MSNAQIPKKLVLGNPRTGTADVARKRRTATNPWTRPGAILSIVVLALAVLMALIPGLFTSQSPFDSQTTALLAPSGEHWFGTDSVGRDLYARVLPYRDWTKQRGVKPCWVRSSRCSSA